MRCEILLDIAAHPNSEPHEVHRRIGRPRHTVRRELEALHMLRLLQCEESDETNDKGKVIKTIYEYSLADEFDLDTLKMMTTAASAAAAAGAAGGESTAQAERPQSAA